MQAPQAGSKAAGAWLTGTPQLVELLSEPIAGGIDPRSTLLALLQQQLLLLAVPQVLERGLQCAQLLQAWQGRMEF